MAGDHFRKRQSGDPFVMKAPLYNALIDAAQQTKQHRHDTQRDFQPEHRSSTIVPIRNSSGADRARGGLLGIAGPIIGPADNFDEFLQRIALEGTAPTLAHVGRWAVLLEPLPAGAIGRAVVSGLAIGLVTIRNAQHQYVEIGTSGQLESGDAGSARIVWAAGVTGTQWAVINIDSPRSLQAKFELIQDLEEGGTANAYLLYQDNLGNWRRVTPNVTETVNAGDYSVENPPNDDRSGSSFSGVKFGGADASNSGDVVEAVGWIEGTTLRWFAIGAGHKVVTGTVTSDVSKGGVGTVTVDLMTVDTRSITILAQALMDVKQDADVICWWNGPLRQWEMADLSELADGTYEAACGIVIDEEADPPTIGVDASDLVGPGLAQFETCGLTVVAGCGIQVAADVSVDAAALAGAGLVPAGAGCALDVNPGCGIRVFGDEVRFEPADVVGAALGAVGDCGIDVLYGCGLFINAGNALEVDAGQLAGPGLTVYSQFGDCVLGVTTGCGLVFSDATQEAVLDVDLRGFDGCGLNAVQMTPGNDCWGLEVDADEIAGPGLGVYSQFGNCVLGVTTGCGLVFSDATQDAILDVDLRGFDGCGLNAVQMTPGNDCWGLEVDAAEMAGPGLTVYGQYGNCVLGIATGCGLTFSDQTQDATLNVDLRGFAGPGLQDWYDGVGGCWGLQVDCQWISENCDFGIVLGCGLTENPLGEIEVVPADLAGPGLVAGAGCALQVATGCGLVFGAINELNVDLRGFDGPGLIAWQDPVSLCWGLQIDCNWIETNCSVGGGGSPTAGCGLVDNAGVFDVDPLELAGLGLVPGLVGCTLDVDCDYIRSTCLGGFSGVKPVYVDDGFGEQTLEEWTFDDGVLVNIEPVEVPLPPP